MLQYPLHISAVLVSLLFAVETNRNIIHVICFQAARGGRVQQNNIPRSSAAAACVLTPVVFAGKLSPQESVQISKVIALEGRVIKQNLLNAILIVNYLWVSPLPTDWELAPGVPSDASQHL